MAISIAAPASVAAALHHDAVLRLHGRMLAAGWSPDEIDAVEHALLRSRLHDTYLAAGWSPEEIEAVVGMYPAD